MAFAAAREAYLRLFERGGKRLCGRGMSLSAWEGFSANGRGAVGQGRETEARERGRRVLESMRVDERGEELVRYVGICL